MARFAAVTALIAACFAALPLFAQESTQELEELLRIVSEETDIATRTKMNRDYVPGILTVLDGETLEALGCRTVLDALSFVPGIQAFREMSGAPNLSVRGIAFPFNAGNTKVLINSVAISREDAGINSAALLTPIEQVDRIEIVRGPSSSIHGGFAFAGLINVITRDQGGRVFGGATEHGYFGGAHWSASSGAWRFSGSTAPYAGKRGEGAVGTSPEANGSTSALRIANKGFAFSVHHLQRNQTITPPGSPFESESFERSTSIDARQQFKLSPSLSAEARISRIGDEHSTPSGGQSFKGDVVEASGTLQWRATRRQQLLADVMFTRSHIDRAHLLLGPPTAPILRTDITDTDRRVRSFTLQDQIEVGDKLTVTLGLRNDRYDDVGDRITPRAALVYRATNEHTFKAQYAEGFRPPTFWELYAPGSRNPTLDFEVMRTTEVGYVYHRPDAVVRLTLFRANIDDMLFLVLPPRGPGPTIFENNTSARSDGAELELELQPHERLRWLANVSHVRTEDGRITSGPGGDSAAAADWLGNLGVIYRPFARTVLALRVLHVGERHTITGKADGYDTVDFTTSFAANAWTLRTGIRNLLDDEVTYLLAFPNATAQVEFASRTFWATVSRKF